MQVATFGPSSGWAGKTITYENGVFVLQDHGPVSAAEVMRYDEQGQLVWTNDGTRAWVASRAQGPAGNATTNVSAAAPAGTAAKAPAKPQTEEDPERSRALKRSQRGCLTAIAVVVVIAVAIAAVAYWPRHHAPTWDNVVASIQNGPAVQTLTGMSDAEVAQNMVFSDTFTLPKDTLVQIMGVANTAGGELTSTVLVSGFVVPSSVPQDAADVGNNLSTSRSFACGDKDAYLEMPAGTYYVGAVGSGHVWNLFVSTQTK